MKKTILSLLALALLSTAALTAPDSLRCRMIDWMDAPGETMVHGPWSSAYIYSGTCYWDLAMGEDFLVWVTGTNHAKLIDPYNQGSISEIFDSYISPWNVYGASFGDDSLVYFGSGMHIRQFKAVRDSLIGVSYFDIPWASFHYAEIEDTFLYSYNADNGDVYCINIANPESLFIYRTMDMSFIAWGSGLKVYDGYFYQCGTNTVSVLHHENLHRPAYQITKADMLNSPTPDTDSVAVLYNRTVGSIDSRDSLLFYVSTFMSDYDEMTGTGFESDSSYLGVWGYDYSYVWSNPVGELAIGIEVLNEYILAVGFEHGFSIINYEQLGGMTEVAYYRNEDSLFSFSHFALKDSTLFAIAHPREGICRMYMFELDEGVISGQGEASIPEQFQFYNYPNPFNGECKMVINSDNDYRNCMLEIFDINGRKVFSEITNLKTGANKFIWNPQNASSGLYFARIVLGDKTFTAKLVYLQ